VTNRDLLVRVLRHPAFLTGDTDTAFLDRHDVTEPLADKETRRLSGLAAALAQAAENRRVAPVLGSVPSGWRNVVSAPQRATYLGLDGELAVTYRLGRTGLVAEGYPGVSLVSATPDRVLLEVAGVRRAFIVARYGLDVQVDSALGAVWLRTQERFSDPTAETVPGSLLAPIPGTVVRLGAGAGDPVRAGQALLWLEAMKMQHRIESPADGVLTELRVAVGDAVDTGAVLAVVSSDPLSNEETP
jgi:propionyl-CoA carboxylase alpha chain